MSVSFNLAFDWGHKFTLMQYLKRCCCFISTVFDMLSQFGCFISTVFDVLSQFAMLYMLLSLSLGWTLGTTYRNTHLQMISKRPAARVVAVLAVLQVCTVLIIIKLTKNALALRLLCGPCKWIF